MKRILVVDDNSVCLSLAKSMLADSYSVSAVLSGEQAVKFLEKRETDLILLDINMPDMSGFEALKNIRENPLTQNVPIIFLTSDNDPETERKCFEMGAYDFIVKPFQKATLRSRVGRTLELLDLKRDLEGQILEKTKQIARISLKSMMLVANTVDKKDPNASQHSTHVAWFAVEIAKRLGWTGEDLYNIQNLALVHDIGKIGISDNILTKRGPLTPEEFEMVKKHTTFGKSILQDMTVMRKAAEVAEAHHERYDGKGYPNGLSGEDIPIEARIIAAADAFDAMTSDRSFRQRLTTEEVLEQFSKGRGTQFDPKIADITIQLINEGRTEPDDYECDIETDISYESNKLLQKVLQEYTREIKSEAQRDALTGLWNRNYTADVLNEYLVDKRHSGCFFMIDIDDFKKVNDSFGHIVGDQVIRNFAQSLSNIVRNDDIICRIGGDEFIVFMKGTSSRSFAGSKAEDIINYLHDTLRLPDGSESISVSIGISIAPMDGSDFSTLYNKADKALYHVKAKGKRFYHFFSDEAKNLSNTAQSTHLDLEYLRRFIEDRNMNRGNYPGEYENFQKIYKLIARAQKRSKQPVLMVLLTITDGSGEIPESGITDEAMFNLKNAVTTAIRSGDVATNFSASQYFAILVDSSPANGYLVAEKIRKLFYEYTDGMSVKLTYDIDATPIVHCGDSENEK